MFTSLPINNVLATLMNQSGTRRPSPAIWQKFSGASLSHNGVTALFGTSDDFCSVGGFATGISGATAGYFSGYSAYIDTGTGAASIAPTELTAGAIRASLPAQDNHEAWMQAGGGAGVHLIDGTTLYGFEARVRVNVLTDLGVAVGVSQTGSAAANMLTDNDGAVSDKNQIIFHSDTAAPTVVDLVYKADGQTAQVLIAGVHTWVAAEWVKLGFLIDPTAEPSRRGKFFVNGQEQSTYLTAAQLAAATFPSDALLSPIFGLKTGAAAVKSADLDYWYSFQAE